MTKVPYGEKPDETAILLLAAAEGLGLDASVVRTSPGKKVFIVPSEVADRATNPEPEKEEKKSSQKAPKKAPAAKKAPAKKTAAKKAATNKKEGSK